MTVNRIDSAPDAITSEVKQSLIHVTDDLLRSFIPRKVPRISLLCLHDDVGPCLRQGPYEREISPYMLGS